MCFSSLLPSSMHPRTANNPWLVLRFIVTATGLLLAVAAALRPEQDHSHRSGCIPAERAALLSFRKGITADPTNRLAPWHGGDCCRWRGVSCSIHTGRVLKLDLRNRNPGTDSVTGCDDEHALFGEISPSLLSLEQLQHLDLSWNCLTSERQETVPPFLARMKSLTYLNLSGIPFSGEVPPQLGELLELQYLDLGSQDHGSRMHSADITWLQNLPLQYLGMSNVNLSQVPHWPRVLNRIPSLRTVDLSSCSLASANQSLPLPINLTELTKLDLSGNDFDHEIAASWFWKATNLRYLHLRYHRFFGRFGDALANMTSLQVLDLSFGMSTNQGLVFEGNFKNLCGLETLDLTDNGMRGDIAVLMGRLPECAWDTLQELHLGSNDINGSLPSLVGRFTALTVLDLSKNNLAGNIPPELSNCTCLNALDLSDNQIVGPLRPEFRHLTGLTTLDLSNNRLSGSIPPEAIGSFTNLTSLVLSSNNFSGVIKEEHFAALASLKKVDLSRNGLKLSVDRDWRPVFRVEVALFASCQMGPLFPAWLQQQPEITKLDVSSTLLAGRIPDWFWRTLSQAIYMDLSNNQLSGNLPANLADMAFVELNISSNLLSGPIPPLPRNISILDMSSNSFSGTLPPNLEAPQLQTLLMYSNRIGGSVPGSLCKLNLLSDLDLSNNLLEGEIPRCFSESSQYIEFLLLSNNSLSGAFPAFLQNCTGLQFLDLAWNSLSGRLPEWIGELSKLQFLRLSHNTFSGNIPAEITNLGYLQFLDLSNNSLSGVIPWHLSSLTAMTLKGSRPLSGVDMGPFPDGDPQFSGVVMPIAGQFGEIMPIVMKGQLLRYGRTLAYFINIDLSGNSLTGEIPLDITSLDALINLNLSSNRLTGKIPDKIGALQSLESLDLSMNLLSGEIPPNLSDLTSLSYLNLSYNSLSGRIPSGRQLDTLSVDNPSLMYLGNDELCGPPLRKNCSSGNDTPTDGYDRNNKHGHEPLSLYLGPVLGFVVGLWMVFCVLLFVKSWRIAYFRLFDSLYDRVYVLVVVKWATLTRSKAAQ